MDCSDIELFESVDHVDGGLHGSVGGGLISIGLDLHAAGDSDEGFSAGEIGDVEESVVPGGEDMTDSEDISGGVLGTKSSLLFFGGLLTLGSSLGSFLFASLLGGFLDLLDFLDLLGRFLLLYFSHNIKLIFYK